MGTKAHCHNCGSAEGGVTVLASLPMALLGHWQEAEHPALIGEMKVGEKGLTHRSRDAVSLLQSLSIVPTEEGAARSFLCRLVVLLLRCLQALQPSLFPEVSAIGR